MSDTDSVVLPYPLPDLLVGNELGQMKLVHTIKKGVFIRKKFYYILDSEGKEIIKASGLDTSKLNYDSFKNLLAGASIEIERTSFNVEWKTLNVNVVNSKQIVKGLTENIKTLDNVKDVNYKLISFPINYNIMVHPLYPVVTEIKIKEKNKNNAIDKHESDLIIMFSKLEIILFIVSLWFLFIFILTYIYFFK